jgi:hypothetical protein
MTLEEIIAQARLRLDDLVETYLNTDADLITYVNNGVREACRRSLAQNISLYEIDPRVIFIERASVGGSRLKRISLDQLDTIPGWESATGTPKYYSLDYSDGKVLVYPTPGVDANGATVNLTVYRTPLDDLSSSSDSPEIPEELHHGIIYWVCYEAYRRQDIDLEAQQKAANEYASFGKVFGEPQTAARLLQYKRQYPRETFDPVVQPVATQQA